MTFFRLFWKSSALSFAFIFLFAPSSFYQLHFAFYRASIQVNSNWVSTNITKPVFDRFYDIGTWLMITNRQSLSNNCFVWLRTPMKTTYVWLAVVYGQLCDRQDGWRQNGRRRTGQTTDAECSGTLLIGNIMIKPEKACYLCKENVYDTEKVLLILKVCKNLKVV